MVDQTADDTESKSGLLLSVAIAIGNNYNFYDIKYHKL